MRRLFDTTEVLQIETEAHLVLYIPFLMVGHVPRVWAGVVLNRQGVLMWNQFICRMELQARILIPKRAMHQLQRSADQLRPINQRDLIDLNDRRNCGGAWHRQPARLEEASKRTSMEAGSLWGSRTVQHRE